MIRIGSSCALSKEMAIGYAVETRILTDGSTKWKEVSKHCIDNKLYLIVTPCVNDAMGKAHIPSDSNWQKLIKDTCRYLYSIGMRVYNGKISIINEPTKYFRDNGGAAKYTHLTNLAYPIIKSFGFRTGAGNMEFYDAQVLGDWYRYICINAKFNDLDIHIQGSCDNEERIKKYTDYAKGLCELYNKKLDCTEAFYGNIETSSGWNLLQRQLYHAERIGCSNFANVFNNLDTSVFPILSDLKVMKKWTELCFKINGMLRSNYWAQWKILMDYKVPVPNIPIIESEDDMKLVNLKPGSKGGQVRWLQEILMLEYGYPNDYDNPFDGKYGNFTKEQVLKYQKANGLAQDGVVGINTTLDLLFDVDEKPVEARVKSTDYWFKRLDIMARFWPVI